MKIEAKDLRDAIAQGIRSVASRVEQLTGERGKVPHPEYLTTTCVGFHLSDYFTNNRQRVVVRFEEQTGVIWRMGEVRAFLSRRPIPAKELVRELRARVRNLAKRGKLGWRKRLQEANRKLRDANRIGNVDIALFDARGFEHPFAIVENKGLLKFSDDGCLYAGSRAELDKDIRRNAYYVSKHSQFGGVQFAAFTFYLDDQDSATMLDAGKYTARQLQYFESHLENLKLDSSIQADVLIETWAASVPSSPQEAQELDDLGQLERGHIAFGVLSLYVKGELITDELRLSKIPFRA